MLENDKIILSLEKKNVKNEKKYSSINYNDKNRVKFKSYFNEISK